MLRDMGTLEQILAADPSEPVPIRAGRDGALRIGGTRVTLEPVVQAFEAGATPEEIASDYPALRLDDVYAVATFILRHRAAVLAWVEKRLEAADARRREIERGQDLGWLRNRLAVARARAV